MASLPLQQQSHDAAGYVAPSSFLGGRSRGTSHPIAMAQPAKTEPESAIDRDQKLGLVSIATSRYGHTT